MDTCRHGNFRYRPKDGRFEVNDSCPQCEAGDTLEDLAKDPGALSRREVSEGARDAWKPWPDAPR
jgi:hypothetical protein